ncbi:DNA repair protein RecO [Candidatus Jorgensenbacteria bacterium]|nr:DNA repair protein RecO [Candidatus Jorgensenbacteria bacterium]
MQEYLTDAIVLRTESRREFDEQVELYTKELGRVSARVIGGRRNLSKLAGHLDPLNLVTIRLVKKGGFTVTDVLTVSRFPRLRENVGVLGYALELSFLIRSTMPKLAPDFHVWYEFLRALKSRWINIKLFLKLLGYDPMHASCESCGKREIVYFTTSDHSFLCNGCRAQFPERGVVYI